ncbi:MAG: hypothetical protein KBD14_01810 [Candidatus Pacebacteria bacterium]|nr:hypothetical protein [Candidatus Paceibacterota bacterium]
MYNLHPIFVHFPIALLFVYSIIKILPVYRWLPNVAWRDIERVLLVFGLGGAYLSLSTGEQAADLSRPNESLVEAHEFFANFSTRMYLLIMIGEVANYLNTKNFTFINKINYLPKLIAWIEKVLTNKNLVLILVVLGFITLFLTGVLGGVLVYGTTADPLAPFILKILNINL